MDFPYFLHCYTNTKTHIHSFVYDEKTADPRVTKAAGGAVLPLHQISWWHGVQTLINSLFSSSLLSHEGLVNRLGHTQLSLTPPLLHPTVFSQVSTEVVSQYCPLILYSGFSDSNQRDHWQVKCIKCARTNQIHEGPNPQFKWSAANGGATPFLGGKLRLCCCVVHLRNSCY